LRLHNLDGLDMLPRMKLFVWASTFSNANSLKSRVYAKGPSPETLNGRVVKVSDLNAEFTTLVAAGHSRLEGHLGKPLIKCICDDPNQVALNSYIRSNVSRCDCAQSSSWSFVNNVK